MNAQEVMQASNTDFGDVDVLNFESRTDGSYNVDVYTDLGLIELECSYRGNEVYSFRVEGVHVEWDSLPIEFKMYHKKHSPVACYERI